MVKRIAVTLFISIFALNFVFGGMGGVIVCLSESGHVHLVHDEDHHLAGCEGEHEHGCDSHGEEESFLLLDEEGECHHCDHFTFEWDELADALTVKRFSPKAPVFVARHFYCLAVDGTSLRINEAYEWPPPLIKALSTVHTESVVLRI